MAKYEFDNLGYILLTKGTNQLVFVQIDRRINARPYEQNLIADLNKVEVKNDYDLMQILSDKMFYNSKIKTSTELKKYNYTLKALQKGAQFEILKKYDSYKNGIVLTIPSTVSSEEKWLLKYDMPEPDWGKINTKTFVREKYINKFLKPAFNDAILRYDEEMAKKELNPLYVTEQER